MYKLKSNAKWQVLQTDRALVKRHEATIGCAARPLDESTIWPNSWQIQVLVFKMLECIISNIMNPWLFKFTSMKLVEGYLLYIFFQFIDFNSFENFIHEHCICIISILHSSSSSLSCPHSPQPVVLCFDNYSCI